MVVVRSRFAGRGRENGGRQLAFALASDVVKKASNSMDRSHAYFECNRVERPLRDVEQQLVAHLRDALAQCSPEQMDAQMTALTSEGDSILIAIMPHCALDGISLCLWFDDWGVQLFWAHVGGLAQNHDTLDCGKPAREIRATPSGTWLRDVINGVKEELRRELEVVVRHTGDVTHPFQWECFALLEQHRRRIGGVGVPVPSTFAWLRRLWPKGDAERSAQEAYTEVRLTTSLCATSVLPFKYPPRLYEDAR